MEINKRIIALIEILGLTPSEFADKIHVQRSGISHITSGRNKPSLDFLESTLLSFPEINSEWLIIGKGKPLKSQNIENDDYLKTEKNFYTTPSETLSDPLLFPVDEIKKEDSHIEKKIKSSISKYDKPDNKNRNLDNEEKVNQMYAAKKEIQKIIILYTDNTFEVYKNKKD